MFFAFIVPSITALAQKKAPRLIPRMCSIGVLDQEDLHASFGFPACSWADFKSSYNVSTEPYYNTFTIPAYFRKDGVAWADADYVMLDLSCYYMKEVASFNGQSGQISKAGAKNVFSELVPRLGDSKLLRGKTLVGVGTFPLVTPCPVSASESTKYLLIRGDPLNACPSARRLLDFPYQLVGQRTLLPVSERRYSMSLVGDCVPTLQQARGKYLQAGVVEAFENVAGAYVRCTGPEYPEPPSFDERLEVQQQSIFCLVMSGEVRSSRRAVEALFAGCIPVFLGPPFHFLPLPQIIPWADISISVHVKQFDQFAKVDLDLAADKFCKRFPTCFEPEQPMGPTHATVNTVEDVALALRQLDVGSVKEMLRRVGSVQHLVDPIYLEDVVEDFVCAEELAALKNGNPAAGKRAKDAKGKRGKGGDDDEL